jgi:Xaa-Pro dipeptidase
MTTGFCSMSLYHQHIQTLIQRYNEACHQFQLDAIVLHSGSTSYIAEDDRSYPFSPYPFAQQWLPYDLSPDTWVVFSPKTGLTLYWPAKQDFWHVVPEEPSGDWTADWSIVASTDLSWINALTGKIAVISPNQNLSIASDRATLNSPELKNWLGYDRAYKTSWEIQNLKIANDRAVLGHEAAENAFKLGCSEYDIHLAYLQASNQQQIEEPYGSIVALNQAAAVLHYEKKNTKLPSHFRTLLIDAGVNENGYASDITRTYSAGTSSDASVFSNLISEVDAYQQQLCERCVSGTPYLDIHNLTLEFTAKLLKTSGLCALSVDEQLQKKIPQVFFPHGIGHLLGLQVHDFGGHQIDRKGMTAERPEHAPFLRLMRTLETDMVVTIEPGLYFIPMLIDNMIATHPNHGCDLDLIDHLKPFGGIRIEDNVVVKKDKALNLTRTSFSELKE